MADTGRMVIQREFDTRDHWWRAQIEAQRIRWEWETVQRPLDQADFPTVDWVDFTVKAHLTEQDWETWHASALHALKGYVYDEDVYGELSDGTVHIDVGTRGGQRKLPPLHLMRQLATQVLAFPERVQP